MGLFKNLIPPPEWQLPVIILMGVIVGMGFYIMKVSNVGSYLSDEPETCVNCHIMAPQYATWSHSSHREVATCNDCHVPHDNFFRKWAFKASDGMRHAAVFTARAEPQTIYINEAGKDVVQNNCVRCHDALISNPKLLAQTFTYKDHFKDRLCWDCHRETPHGRVNSLSSVPFARVPTPKSIVPDWLKSKTK